jgi:hypothetical protein
MNRLRLALLLPALLALAQQQLLLRRPPHLEALRPAAASTGPAALQVRFSRPMDRGSVAAESRLEPPLRHRWYGADDQLLLALEEGQRITTPLTLTLAGRDRRGLALPPQRWRWDPRPRLLAVVPVPGGEQLRLRQHDGSWRPLGPAFAAIPVLEPLGDGSGVAVASRAPDGSLRAWRLPLQQRNLAPLAQGLAAPQPGPPRLLSRELLQFAHLSSNARGEVLLQAAGAGGAQERSLLWPPQGGGGGRDLGLTASGPMRLLPGGGAVVVPRSEGLELVTLPPRPPRRQTLPGSRDLVAFCPQAGRALLLRHWPDFRRSLELVEPGQAPRQLWLGAEGLAAAACARGGDRVWALLVAGLRRPDLTLLALDRRGTVLARRRLSGWELEPGTALQLDPGGGRLLATLRPIAADGRPAGEAQAVLIDATSLELEPLPLPLRQAVWLPAG